MMQHLACIMDGNRRWARTQALQPLMGHKEGAQAVQRVVEFCLKEEIKYLSLYAFSLENFNRSAQETGYLFDLIIESARRYINDFVSSGVRVRFVGQRDRFPTHILPAIVEIEEKTKDVNCLQLQILFCYGARQEIIEATKSLIKKVENGELSSQEIGEELFSNHLWTAGIPEPDLIIRTGGAMRLSNFLLYQAAYSEFYFMHCFWPEINETHLRQAVDYFKECKRNFGS